MAKSIVNAGACGHAILIEVTRLDKETVAVRLETDCTNVLAMNPALASLKWRGKDHVVFKGADKSAIYAASVTCRLHAPCPVPSAILRTIEVELGMAVPKPMSVTFLMDGPETSKPGPRTRAHALTWQDWLEISAVFSGLVRVRSRFLPLDSGRAAAPATRRGLAPDDALAERTVAVARAGLYNFFSTAFADPPTPGLVSELQTTGALALLNAKGFLDEDLRAWCAQLGAPGCAEALSLAYTLLLVRPGPDRVAPVASEHLPWPRLGSESMEWGPAAQAAVAAYQESDLAIGGDGPFTPDHVGLELQFMQHCAAREAAAWGAGQPEAARLWRQRQATFLASALLPWVPSFCARAAAAQPHPYYQAVADLLSGFLPADAAFLAGQQPA